MIEFEEYKSKLNDLKPKLEELRAAFLPQALLDELERLHAMAEAPGFWDDPARSQKAVMRTKQLEHKRDKFEGYVPRVGRPVDHLRDGIGGGRRLHA